MIGESMGGREEKGCEWMREGDGRVRTSRSKFSGLRSRHTTDSSWRHSNASITARRSELIALAHGGAGGGAGPFEAAEDQLCTRKAHSTHSLSLSHHTSSRLRAVHCRLARFGRRSRESDEDAAMDENDDGVGGGRGARALAYTRASGRRGRRCSRRALPVLPAEREREPE